MTPETREIAERLRKIAHESPVEAVRRQAVQLRTRLLSPVRVVILGLPGAGKLDLAAKLAGENSLPAALKGITFELRHGETEETEITLTDGSIKVIAGALGPDDLDGAAFAVLKRPLPGLEWLSLLAVAADASPREQQAAIAWARRRTDIAVWCSRDFADLDRAVWSLVPDEIRDHAFLVLTEGSSTRAAALRVRHRFDFVDVCAMDGSDHMTEDLAARISTHAAAGQQSDADNALLFLRSQEGPARPATRPRPPTRPRTIDLVQPTARTASRPLSRHPTRPLSRQVAAEQGGPREAGNTFEPKTEPALAYSRPVSTPAQVAPVEPSGPQGLRLAAAAVPAGLGISDAAPLGDAAAHANDHPAPTTLCQDQQVPAERPRLRRANVSRPVISTGFSFLRGEAETLLREVRAGRADEGDVLERCSGALSHLADIVAFDDEVATRPDLMRLAETIQEAEAMVVLLGAETGGDAALDAVSLLLQVRHDFESCMAA